MNEALYINRQYFFNERKSLGYEKTYAILKASENYRILNSNMAQQCMKVVDGMFASFASLLRLVKRKQYDSRAVKIPHYLPKDGFAPLVIQQFTIRNHTFALPYSKRYGAEHEKISVKVPPILEGQKVKFVKIIPMNKARFFEIQYVYEAAEEQRELDKQKALAIDFGVNNLMTCATSEGGTFIIDGWKLKAINQWYNKENTRLSSIKDKQKLGKKPTSKQRRLARKRKLRVNLPYGEILQKIEYLCVEYVEQEESYTSKASFWDKDEIPIYNADNPQSYEFSGRRIHRRLYRTSTGFEFNADVNGALNILRKSNVVSLLGYTVPYGAAIGADWPRP